MYGLLSVVPSLRSRTFSTDGIDDTGSVTPVCPA